MAFFEFPHTRTYDSDLGWIIYTIRKLLDKMENISEITFADPIGWNITSQYPQNQIVKDPQSGILYLSKQPVPAGVALTNQDYWLEIGNFSYEISYLKDAISAIDEGTAVFANYDHAVNDYIWWNDKFYHVEKAIAAGDLLASGDNLKLTSVGERLSHFSSTYWLNVKDYGAIGDGVTDDSDAIQAAIDQTEYNTIVFPAGTYMLTKPLNIKRSNFTMVGYGATLTKDAFTNNFTLLNIRADSAAANLEHIKVIGLEFDGKRPRTSAWDSSNEPLIAVYSGNTYRVYYVDILDCYLHDNIGRGIGLDGGNIAFTPRVRYITIDNCKIEYCRGNIVQSIAQSTISNCFIASSGLENITVDNGCLRCHIHNNNIHSQTGGAGGIGIDAVREMIIDSNYIDGFGSADESIGYGISINSNRGMSRNIIISNNIICNNKAYGLRVRKQADTGAVQYLNVNNNNFMGNSLGEILIGDGSLENKNYFNNNSYISANKIILENIANIAAIWYCDAPIALAQSDIVSIMNSDYWSIGNANYTYIFMLGKDLHISGDFIKTQDGETVIMVLPSYLQPIYNSYIFSSPQIAYIQAGGRLRYEQGASMAINSNIRMRDSFPIRR